MTMGLLGRPQVNQYPKEIASMEFQEKEIIDRIHDGDIDAFEILFKQYQKRLFQFIWHIVRSPEAADDILQNVFLKIWQGRKTWRLEASLSSYLFRSARNAAFNYLRDNKSNHLLPLDDSQPDTSDPEQVYTESEVNDRVKLCIDSLPPKCKSVFLMSRYEDLKYKQISDILEISIKTVENQMGRALRLLRECLKSFI